MTKNERRVAMRRLNDPNYKRADPAPASPRVAEELLKDCARILDSDAFEMEHLPEQAYVAGVFRNRREHAIAKATAIIALAQDAARREDAAWCEAQWPFSSKPYPEWYPYYLSIASHLRAMMVKP